MSRLAELGSKCAPILIAAMIAPGQAQSAIVCTRDHISKEYLPHANRAYGIIGSQTTTDPSQMRVYIERDQHENPYYHSNYRAVNRVSAIHYHYPTKIGGKDDPIFDLDQAIAHILFGVVPPPGHSGHSRDIRTAALIARSTKFFIDRSIFAKHRNSVLHNVLLRQGSISFLDSFYLVNTNDKIRGAATYSGRVAPMPENNLFGPYNPLFPIQRRLAPSPMEKLQKSLEASSPTENTNHIKVIRKRPGGGLTDCEPIYECASDLFGGHSCGIPDLDQEIKRRIRLFLCEDY